MRTSVAAHVRAWQKQAAGSPTWAWRSALAFSWLSPPEPAEAATCPCTIFTSDADPDCRRRTPTPSAVELGVKFRADQDGFCHRHPVLQGHRQHRHAHRLTLEQTDGTRLATVTFTGETATGWQQANFASPVAVTANTTYVASYYAPNGRYSADEGFFATSGVSNSPLTALQDGVDGGNGVYRYGAAAASPTARSAQPTTGSTWSSTRAAPTRPSRRSPTGSPRLGSHWRPSDYGRFRHLQ